MAKNHGIRVKIVCQTLIKSVFLLPVGPCRVQGICFLHFEDLGKVNGALIVSLFLVSKVLELKNVVNVWNLR